MSLPELLRFSGRAASAGTGAIGPTRSGGRILLPWGLVLPEVLMIVCWNDRRRNGPAARRQARATGCRGCVTGFVGESGEADAPLDPYASMVCASRSALSLRSPKMADVFAPTPPTGRVVPSTVRRRDPVPPPYRGVLVIFPVLVLLRRGGRGEGVA